MNNVLYFLIKISGQKNFRTQKISEQNRNFVTIQGLRFLKYLCFVDPLNHGDGSSDFPK